MRRLLGILILILCGNVSISLSQNIKISATVDTTDYLIGDWINLTFKAEHPEEFQIIWPPVLDSLKGFEIIEKPDVVVSDDGNITVQTQKYVLTVFDTGRFEIPEYQFLFKQEGKDDSIAINTIPLEIYVNTVELDTAMVVKDVKKPLKRDYTLEEILPYAAGGALVIILAWLIYSYYQRRKNRIQIPYDSKVPKIPPYRVATKALQELEEERIWQQGKIKLYYSKLTDILRIYLEHQFQMQAMESTTDEILDEIDGNKINASAKETLMQLLVTADLAKFAKNHPNPSTNEYNMKKAFDFVNQTKPSDITEKQAKQLEVTNE
ncbi:hypothetical protein JYT59_00445 [Sphingobacteriaceae bacterium AH-315-L07]|nr:hypothetical protein [Sphingobacteriaceae bacterium AH-315-L07]